MTYLDGLREWELAANVKFVPHTNQTHWILFAYNTNCLDYVSGGSHNPQVVTVSSLSRAQVCHEMGHSFGFTHENIRPDATNYITVLTNNIADEPTNIYWFTIDPTTRHERQLRFRVRDAPGLGFRFDQSRRARHATAQAALFSALPIPHGQLSVSAPATARRWRIFTVRPPCRSPTSSPPPPTVGPGSLRAAIYYATDHPGTAVSFNIPTSDPGYSNGVFNIHLTGHVAAAGRERHGH